MAFRHGDAFTQAGVHDIGYYVQKIMSGAYTLHASTIQTTGNNNTRYTRTSQEASDNARLIFDILMDSDVASYELFNGVVDKFWGGSFAASFYYNFGQGQPTPDIPTDPTLYGRCQAFIDNPLDVACQAGTKQPGLFPGGNGSYYTAVCALLGYIDVVSGYNPAHNMNHYAGIFDGIGNYPDTATLTPPTIYTDNGFPRYPGVAQRPIDITPNYDFPIQYDTSGAQYTRPWVVRWNENYRQELMEYGILGLTCPVSVNGYSYQIPICYNAQKTVTQGNVINLLEQIWFDILGLPRGNGNSNGSIAEGRNSDHLRMRGLGIPYYSNGYSYFPFTAQGGSRYYNVTGSASSASSPSVFENDWQYWNGSYTKRPFTRNMAEYAMFEKWGLENILPPFSTPTDYEAYPWCCMVQDGDTDGAVLDLVHSIQTWREASYWTTARIQQAQDAARYWYQYFYSEHQGGGTGTATPAGRQKQWRWVVYR